MKYILPILGIILTGCASDGPPSAKTIRDNAYCTRLYAPTSSDHEYCRYQKSVEKQSSAQSIKD